MMSIIRLAALGLAASLATAAVAQPKPAEAFSLVGTYRLISTTQTVVATGEVKEFGHNSIGYIMYGADGRMMAMIGDKNRPVRDPKDMDDKFKAQLFDTLGGYGGSYTFDGKKVVHHIDISTRQLFTGTDQVRYVEKHGNQLLYTTAPSASPRDGVVVVFKSVWEKVPDNYLAPKNAQ
jgi:hypothetical protein